MTTLYVVRALGLVTVQDLGRPGHMHEGLAPGGALVPELLIAANRAAHNPDDAAAIEVCGQLVVRAEAPVRCATDRVHLLRAGDELVVASEPRRVAYLGVRGGIEAPMLVGGRGTQLSAGLGRVLRSGDRVRAAGAAERRAPVPVFRDTTEIAVVPGPDSAAFVPDALHVLTASTYRISPTSDRVGTRLDGPPLEHARGFVTSTRPMVRGAIEVPPDGAPILLGPEHPTTGGYPIVAVVAHADLGRLFAIRPGGMLRFIAATASPR